MESMLLLPTPAMIPSAVASRPFGFMYRPQMAVDSVTTAMLAAGASLVSCLHSESPSSVSTMNALYFPLAIAFWIMSRCRLGSQFASNVVTVAPGIVFTSAATSSARTVR